MASRPVPHPFDALEGHNYLSLTTYRRSGEGVPTPVWFAREGGALYVFTDSESGKVKRIRNDPRVTLAPCDLRGRVRGGSAEGIAATARVMDRRESEVADRALAGKYGWRYKASRAYLRFRGKEPQSAFLELRPTDGG